MIRAGDEHVCPICGGKLKLYDRVDREVRYEYGKIERIKIRRYKCIKCRKTHRELPKFLIAWKQFRRDIIKGVLDGSISPDDLEYEDFPCEKTMERWKREFGDQASVCENYDYLYEEEP